MEPKPSLLAFLLCERVLWDEDGSPIIWRVIDTMSVTVRGPETAERLGAEIHMAVFTKWGPPAADFTEALELVNSDGRSMGILRGEVRFQGQQMVHVRHDIVAMVLDSGDYFVRLHLDDEVIAVHPLRVVITREPFALPPSPDVPPTNG